jgi:hypothetical protein
MKKEWLNETFRDLISLGGIPFFLLVVVRIFILDNTPYLLKVIFAGILFAGFYFTLKGEYHAGLSLICLIFLSLHYGEPRFTILGTVFYFILIGSLIYLGKKKKEVIKGALFGLLSSVIGYYVVQKIFG